MVQSAPIADPNLIPLPAFDIAEPADALVVAMRGEDVSAGAVATVDAATGGLLTRLIGSGNLRGKKGDLDILANPNPDGPALFVVVGLGDAPERANRNDPGQGRTTAMDAASAAIRRLMDRPRKRIVVAIAEAFDQVDADAIVAGCLTACDGQEIYKSEKTPFVPEDIVLVGVTQSDVQRGRAIGQSINLTRRLINAPASEIYPASFAAEAEQMAAAVGLTAEIWDEEKLASEGCRAILAVGRASALPPRLLILKHDGGAPGERPIAIVGKGVTFDSGGLSIKPSEGMLDMKCDMGGAATVVGAMHAIAKLGVKQNVIGLCGLAENMIAGDAYRLGDVIKTRNGKTIEIHNTDAEGRVVLADTLDVAVGFSPRMMIDLATLTGACVVALGNEVAGLMANNQDIQSAIQSAAAIEGEYVWPLPMFELFDEKVKSKVADIKNVGNGRWGGAITAAKFLEQFVQDVPWCHIDIAGPAFADSPTPARDAGATGALVRTLVRVIESA